MAAERRKILAAEAGGVRTAVAVLAEALTQIEIISPSLSAEVWDAYAAVPAARPTTAPDALAVPEQCAQRGGHDNP